MKLFESSENERKVADKAVEKIREAYMAVSDCMIYSDKPEYEEIATKLLDLKEAVYNVSRDLN